MPRRPDNLETVRLALELLRRIPRTTKVTASELHRQLHDVGIHRDLRTIQRQLEMLSRNFDIERDDGKQIGYRWKRNAPGLSVVAMTEQEALLLMLARQQMASLLPPSVVRSMEPFFVEARRSLDPFGNAKLAKQWLGKVRVVNEGVKLLPPKLASGILETVSQALYANHWLKVCYRNAQGTTISSRVMPLGLAQQGPRLYLVCRFEGHSDDRSLALHRIQSTEISTLDFERPADFDLERFDNDGRFAFGNGKRVKLSFRIDAEHGAHLRETPLSVDQTIREIGDDLLVTATVVDSLHLDWWLRGFGDMVSHIRKSTYRRGASPNSVRFLRT